MPFRRLQNARSSVITTLLLVVLFLFSLAWRSIRLRIRCMRISGVGYGQKQGTLLAWPPIRKNFWRGIRLKTRNAALAAYPEEFLARDTAKNKKRSLLGRPSVGISGVGYGQKQETQQAWPPIRKNFWRGIRPKTRNTASLAAHPEEFLAWDTVKNKKHSKLGRLSGRISGEGYG